MAKVLVLNSSILGADSASAEVLDHALRVLAEQDSALQVVSRDLGAEPVPHLSTANWAGVRGNPVSELEQATRALSDRLLAELRAADTLLIGAPMYNFSIPTALRAWFDHVLRAGETFRYGENGPQGLLSGKRVIVVESRGGMYSQGPAQAMDFQEPYLRQLLGFMGLNQVQFVRVEKLASGAEARQSALRAAKAQIEDLLSTSVAEAA